MPPRTVSPAIIPGDLCIQAARRAQTHHRWALSQAMLGIAGLYTAPTIQGLMVNSCCDSSLEEVHARYEFCHVSS